MCLPFDERTIAEDAAGSGAMSGASTSGGTLGSGGTPTGGVGGTLGGGGTGGEAGTMETGGTTGGSGQATGGSGTAGGSGGATATGGEGGTVTGGKGGTATGGAGGSGTSGSAGLGGVSGSGTSGAGPAGSGGSGKGGAGSGGSGKGGAGAGGSGGTGGSVNVLDGWASVSDYGVPTTTGGGSGTPQNVMTAQTFATAVAGTNAGVVRLNGTISGTFNVGSNKTIEGASAAQLQGSLVLNGSTNVIVRNLKIVGNNCATPDPTTCADGTDAVTIRGGAHHVWVDHCDISNGSDQNLDIVDGSDLVTVSWTKFSYSGVRTGGHQFANLIGASDTATGDMGRLRVTFHHSWWAANVRERMPWARYGKVHLFNNLYDSAGNTSCIRLGIEARILVENSAFTNVANPFDISGVTTNAGLVARGNTFTGTTGNVAGIGTAFDPSASYAYTLDSVGSVPGLIASGVGPR